MPFPWLYTEEKYFQNNTTWTRAVLNDSEVVVSMAISWKSGPMLGEKMHVHLGTKNPVGFVFCFFITKSMTVALKIKIHKRGELPLSLTERFCFVSMAIPLFCSKLTVNSWFALRSKCFVDGMLGEKRCVRVIHDELGKFDDVHLCVFRWP